MTSYEKSREFVLGAALATAILLGILVFIFGGVFNHIFEENKALKKKLNCPEICYDAE